MAARAQVDYRVVAALIFGGLIAGAVAASLITGAFVVVVEATGLGRHFGHHGTIIEVLAMAPTVTGAIYVPFRWRSVALKRP